MALSIYRKTCRSESQITMGSDSNSFTAFGEIGSIQLAIPIGRTNSSVACWMPRLLPVREFHLPTRILPSRAR